MLALYLWPPAMLLSCLSFSNLLLSFIKGTQTHKIVLVQVLEEVYRNMHVQKHTHLAVCLSLFLVLSVAAFQNKESQLSHERKDFHTFHLLLPSLRLTHSALSLSIALMPSARLIDQKG